MNPNTPLADRLWSKASTRNVGECWLWTGYKDRHGYGELRAQGGRQRAHRVAYELTNGPIAEGLVIDHLCRVRHCINPAHLEPVTNAENVRRGDAVKYRDEAGRPIGRPYQPRGIRMSDRTHCPQGHPYDEANTRHVTRRNGTKCRNCKKCESARASARYRARKSN